MKLRCKLKVKFDGCSYELILYYKQEGFWFYNKHKIYDTFWSGYTERGLQLNNMDNNSFVTYIKRILVRKLNLQEQEDGMYTDLENEIKKLKERSSFTIEI